MHKSPAAFPAGGTDFREGMSLRDYFAAKVLQGAMVNATNIPDTKDTYLLGMAKECYRIADAMLQARESSSA